MRAEPSIQIGQPGAIVRQMAPGSGLHAGKLHLIYMIEDLARLRPDLHQQLTIAFPIARLRYLRADVGDLAAGDDDIEKSPRAVPLDRLPAFGRLMEGFDRRELVGE